MGLGGGGGGRKRERERLIDSFIERITVLGCGLIFQLALASVVHKDTCSIMTP